MEIVEFMKHYGKCIKKIGGLMLYPPVICKDGHYMSVQASRNHNSIPTEDLDNHEYEAVEVYVGCDNMDALFSVYSNGYGTCNCVPVEIVDAVINHHGGIDMNAVNAAIESENEK